MPRMSSCARTDSVSPNTLCVTMTSTALMVRMNPQNVVSVCEKTWKTQRECKKENEKVQNKL